MSALYLYRAGYDFKKLFTISEYYDRDRASFYRALQSVREQDMDMTGWLEYFVEGLATQLHEVTKKGEEAILSDVIAKKHKLNRRQARAIGFLLENGSLTIRDYEKLYPGVNRRTLQRDLKHMVQVNVLYTEGSTHQLVYRLTETR
jgi:Fic family protein